MPSMPTDEAQASELRVVPAGEAPFEDVETVFGTRGDPAHCWCQWYKIPGSDWRSVGDEALRERLEAQLAASDSGPGLLAYDGETPVGWCAVEPRPNLVRIPRSRIIAAGTRHPDFDDPTIWAVTCFVIPRAHRRKGVARALAEAAANFAFEHGARIVEGYAVDTAARPGAAAADLFHGTLTMFVNAGFDEVARPKADRVILERRLRD
ncbi:GNAT family N-acetyltransferase [Agromyces sp. Marseille-P2726]|uniref:GNAT family N-acetyltransferase n=1 Tax=Agromyces sp. Marseille-P2726 TaxID=2709132 RepID=UPI001C2D2B34|nr:GNAT family N-acetyltransferase [Agromyces sp. Marseille-P2726]